MHIHFRTIILLVGLLALTACNKDLAVFPRDQGPAAPTGLTATPEPGKVVLRWQDNSDDETGYTVYRLETGGEAAVVGASELAPLAQDGFVKLASLPENSETYTDSTVKAGMRYRFAVQADGEEGSSQQATTSDDPVEVPANTAPTATTQSVSTDEDEAVTVTLTGTDAEGADLSFEIVTAPTKGGLGTVNQTTGEVLYTPNAEVSGDDSFTFTVSDGEYTSAAATVSITVNAVNDTPVAKAQSLSTTEETSLGVTLSANDAEGDSVSYAISSDPANGTVSNFDAATGKLAYVPDKNFSGQDSFTFTASDGNSRSAAATITINVGGVNDAPVAKAQTLSVDEDSELNITLGGDDVDGDELSYAIVDGPSHGSLGTLNAKTGSVTYKPDLNYNGTDSFTFKVSDGTLESEAATVTVVANAVNDIPVAEPQKISTPEDTPKLIVFSGSDADGDDLTYGLFSQPRHGTLGTLNETTGEVVYTPEPNYTGTDVFVFKIFDGGDASGLAPINITVEAVNDAPVIAGSDVAEVTMSEDASPTAFTLNLSADDAEQDSLSWSVSSAASHGNAGVSDGTVSYTPEANYNGSDSFDITVTDGSLNDTVTVNVTIDAVNDAPVIAGEATRNVTMSEDSSPTTFSLSLSASDVDDEVSWSISSNAAEGSAGVTGGVVSYTPNANYSGGDSFVVQASDGELSDSVTVNVTVEAVNDAPVAASQELDVDEDSVLNVVLSAMDVESDSLSYEIVSAPSNGSLGTLNTETGAVSYTPTANYSGPDSFTFKANDGADDSATATVSITVKAVNDPPTDVSLSNDSIDENQPSGAMVGSLSASDVDTGDSFSYSLVAGAGDTDNGRFTVEGTQLKTAAVFDHETDSSLSIRLRVSDGSADFEKVFSISVNDLDEVNPSVTFNTPGSLTEGESTSLSGSFSDNAGVVKVEIFEDTTKLGDASRSGSSWTFTYTPASSGSFTLKAIAYDAAGNSGQATKSVTVDSGSSVDHDLVYSSSTGHNTIGYGDDYGNPSEDVVWKFTPSKSSYKVLDMNFGGGPFALRFIVLDSDGNTVTSGNADGSNGYEISVTMTPGETYYVVVEAADGSSSGSYGFSIY